MASDWRQVDEVGSVTAMRLLAWLCLRLGRTPARQVLRLVVLYYVLTSVRVRRHSKQYLRRVSRQPSWANVYRHVFHFAQCAMDRIYFASGRLEALEISVRGHEHLERALEAGKGGLLFGAHVGSFEALRALSLQKQTPITALVDFTNSKMISALLDAVGHAANTEHRLPPDSVIQASLSDVTVQLQVRERILSGGLVAVLVDRYSAGKYVTVRLLGAEVRWPLGPFHVAASLGCPVYLTLGLFEEPNRYAIFCEPLGEVPQVPRDQRTRSYQDFAQRLAERLETILQSAPYNWFNFYDYWETYER